MVAYFLQLRPRFEEVEEDFDEIRAVLDPEEATLGVAMRRCWCVEKFLDFGLQNDFVQH